jgi:hypothetical protein
MCCWGGLFCNRNKRKILIEFFKNSTDKIINQIEIFYSRTYNTQFKLIDTDSSEQDDIYILINNDNTQKLIIEAKLIKDGFTYRLLIYENHHQYIK